MLTKTVSRGPAKWGDRTVVRKTSMTSVLRSIRLGDVNPARKRGPPSLRYHTSYSPRMPSAVQPRKGRSAQESTLSTPQLLGHILSFLAPLWPKYLVNAALVCKQWTKQAIDLRWSRCNIKFSRLLRKLDPKMEVDKGDYVRGPCFQQPLKLTWGLI